MPVTPGAPRLHSPALDLSWLLWGANLQASLCLECASWVPCTHTQSFSSWLQGHSSPLPPSPQSVWGLLEPLTFAPCPFTSWCLTLTVLHEGRARVFYPPYPGHLLSPKWGSLAQKGLQEILDEGKESRKRIRTNALTKCSGAGLEHVLINLKQPVYPGKA